MPMMHKNQSVNVHQFAMVPKAEVPRSKFRKQSTLKTTFDENYLVPCFVDEVLPGDTFRLKLTAFARLATPIFPVMDNMYLDTFFFFVPNRLVWSHWANFMGEQDNPADSISYTIPQNVAITDGYAINSLQDYFGLPTHGQMNSGSYQHSVLPLRAYNLIWNEWFRDENFQNSVGMGATNNANDIGDGPDPVANYTLLKRGKRHDYFTSALPWTQKGGVSVSLPLGSTAPVRGIGFVGSSGTPVATSNVRESSPLGTRNYTWGLAMGNADWVGEADSNTPGTKKPLIYADLSQATAATINQLRQSFQIQRLLERDARGGTRYTELVRAHFGVISPDMRLQRPEYLGGGTTPITISPIAQTTATGLTGGSTPLGTLSGFGTLLAHGHGFTQSFTEHGHIIGLMNVRADLTYQQGVRKFWKRSTRYDFYFPAFAMLGEQAILNEEIYVTGAVGTGAAQDQGVFGYQERWAEYRYHPSMITGQMRSTYATPLDTWHLAEKFTSLPTLGATFIQSNVPVARAVAVASAGAHFLCDAFFDVECTRPLPMYSVPGLIDHF